MRLSQKLSVLAALSAVVCYFGGAYAADEKKTLSIKDCMSCQNMTRGAILPKGKGKEVDWEAAGKKTKTWLEAAEDLSKNDPPKGTKESWKEQTAKYVTNVKAVDEAVEKKNIESVTRGLATFNASCMGCHAQHKPAKK